MVVSFVFLKIRNALHSDVLICVKGECLALPPCLYETTSVPYISLSDNGDQPWKLTDFLSENGNCSASSQLQAKTFSLPVPKLPSILSAGDLSQPRSSLSLRGTISTPLCHYLFLCTSSCFWNSFGWHYYSRLFFFCQGFCWYQDQKFGNLTQACLHEDLWTWDPQKHE